MTRKPSRVSRRSVLAAASFSFTLLPRHVVGGPGQTPPSERINFAGIGAGGQGGGDVQAMAAQGANVVALCDVDSDRAADNFKRFSKARVYTDFRKMLDKRPLLKTSWWMPMAHQCGYAIWPALPHQSRE